jgi:hypothetical protein
MNEQSLTRSLFHSEEIYRATEKRVDDDDQYTSERAVLLHHHHLFFFIKRSGTVLHMYLYIHYAYNLSLRTLSTMTRN